MEPGSTLATVLVYKKISRIPIVPGTIGLGGVPPAIATVHFTTLAPVDTMAKEQTTHVRLKSYFHPNLVSNLLAQVRLLAWTGDIRVQQMDILTVLLILLLAQHVFPTQLFFPLR